MWSKVYLTHDNDAVARVAAAIGLPRTAADQAWTALLIKGEKVYATSSQFRHSPEELDEFDDSQLKLVFGSVFVSGVPSVPRAMRDEELRLVQQQIADAAAKRDSKVGYVVNLDERGGFYADVRAFDGRTVFEVRGGNELSEDDSSLVDDGFMSSFRDTDGLQEYLRSMGVIADSCEVVSGSEFDEHVRETREAIDALQTPSQVVAGFATSLDPVTAVLEELDAEDREQSNHSRRQAMLA